MQNSESNFNIRPPPPPPPKLPPNCKCIHSCTKEIKLSKRSSQNDIISALRHVTHNFYVEHPANLISFYCPLSPVIQEGRCCGIVALSMASQLISNTSADNILSSAKCLNFTKEGEMFSAYNMAKLASSLLECDATVLDNLDVHKEDILTHICDGNPLLIPYDADKNHFPCSNQGLTAHWAVVSGLCFTVSDKSNLKPLLNCETINEFPELNIFIVKDSFEVRNMLQHGEEIFVYARQGKSRHLAAWNLTDLLESNRNMYEVTKKYTSDQLILPPEDSLSELRNKVVLLKRKN